MLELGGDRAAVLLDLLQRLTATRHDSATPYADLQRRAVDEVAAMLGGATVLWLADASGASRMVAYANRDPVALADMRRLAEGLVNQPDGLVGSVMRSGAPLRVAGDELEDLLPQMAPPYHVYFRAHGLGGMVVVPLLVAGAPLGAFGVARPAGEPPFDDVELAHVQQVGTVLALALDNARLLQDARAATGAAARLSLTDELTRLPNRRALLSELRASLTRRARAGEHVAVLVLDLDGFKLVNDGFGHAAGDAVLVQVARRLSNHLLRRPPHPDGGTVLLARIGGDEFAVLLTRTTPDEALALAGEVVQASQADLQVLGLATPLRASVGVATRAPTGDEGLSDALLQEADLAMYRAKRTVAGCAAYDPAQDAAAETRLRDVAELAEALRQRTVELHYQAFVDPSGARTAPLRFEALVRWRRAGVLLPPGAFLPLAEQAGLMPLLTEAVLDLAVAQLAAWHRGGLDVRCSVNVPAAALRDGLGAGIVARLAAAALPRWAIVLEVTESELLDDAAHAGIRECARHGLTLSVDDFGAGWSSLTHLVDLPLTALKLDAGLVRSIDASRRRQSVVRHVIGTCRELGVKVIAEGVERPEQAEVLRELGVDLLQGFLFARPEPAAVALPGGPVAAGLPPAGAPSVTGPSLPDAHASA